MKLKTLARPEDAIGGVVAIDWLDHIERDRVEAKAGAFPPTLVKSYGRFLYAGDEWFELVLHDDTAEARCDSMVFTAMRPVVKAVTLYRPVSVWRPRKRS